MQLAEQSYPVTDLAVAGPNLQTVEWIRRTGARDVAEIGVYRGYTSRAIAELLAGDGTLHLLDYTDRVVPVADALRADGHRNVLSVPNSRRLLDSYNWSLMRLIEEHEEPIFDYVFLDGAHTWAFDALAFLLVDRLLRPGGHVDFDDYRWTLANSPSMRPEVFPDVQRLYSDEQIERAQVGLVVDLLVRRDPRYEEVCPDKVFRKCAAEAGG